MNIKMTRPKDEKGLVAPDLPDPTDQTQYNIVTTGH